MGKTLYILDQLLADYGGHPFNYDMAVAKAAGTVFDRVEIACGRYFSAAAEYGMFPVFPDVERLRSISALRTVLGRQRREEDFVSCMRLDDTGDPWLAGSWLNRWFSRWRAFLFARAGQRFLRSRPNRAGETQVFFPNADHSVLGAAERLAGLPPLAGSGAVLHLLFRVEPGFFCSRLEAPDELARRLTRLTRFPGVTFRFYTDTAELSREFSRLTGGGRFPVLPIPVFAPPGEGLPVAANAGKLRLGVMGAPRPEKGAMLLPGLMRALPEYLHGRKVEWLLQQGGGMGGNLPPGVFACPASLSPAAYGEAHAGTDIALLLYTSRRYRCSSSGIMADCLRLGIPTLTFAGTWMGGVIEEAHSLGLEIGMGIEALSDFPVAVDRLAANLEFFKRDVEAYYKLWARKNSLGKLVDLLVTPPSF